MTLSAIPKQLRLVVLERDGGRCRYCQLSQAGQAAQFHIDHIIPRSRGGSTDENNLALQCPKCSLHKSDKIRARDTQEAREVELFHPLQHRWGDHFRLIDDGRIVGLTAIGRATAESLKMNDELPVMARKIQIYVGLLTLS